MTGGRQPESAVETVADYLDHLIDQFSMPGDRGQSIPGCVGRQSDCPRIVAGVRTRRELPTVAPFGAGRA
jgi:hypothetical protein